MKIELHEIKVRDLVKGYKDSGDEGVVAYGGNLDVRPPYQREFIYKEKQRNAVIDTIMKGFPLNVMYWVSCGDGKYEVMDGQQRTISIAQYFDNEFTESQKLAAYTRQGGVCKMCGRKFNIDEMNAAHIKPWSKGGHTTPDNCQMLCSTCNFTKSDK